MRTFTLLAILLFSVNVYAAESSVFDFPPGTKLMPAKKVMLRIDENRVAEIDNPARPSVFEDDVNLAPGEKIYVEAEVKDDKLVKLKQVDDIEHPDVTLEIEFKQVVDKNKTSMMLHIINPFQKSLRYESYAQYYGYDQFRVKKNIGVRARLGVYEMWLSPTKKILLRNFELVDEGHRQSP